MAFLTQPSGSGARLLAVATQGFDLIPQQLGSALIPPGEGHRQSELQLFQLMLPFDLGTCLQVATGRGWRAPQRRSVGPCDL
jgi:hypothetical protein